MTTISFRVDVDTPATGWHKAEVRAQFYCCGDEVELLELEEIEVDGVWRSWPELHCWAPTLAHEIAWVTWVTWRGTPDLDALVWQAAEEDVLDAHYRAQSDRY